MSDSFDFEWDGLAMWPLANKAVTAVFEKGEQYRFEWVRERSKLSHDHFFHLLKLAWGTFTPELIEKYPSVEYLRKRMLIATGYCNERTFILETSEAAEKLKVYLQDMDEFSVVDVVGRLVRIRTAKSQKKKEMTAREFQEAKSAILDAIEDEIGVDRGSLAGARVA